jgi:hypothetical protein
MQKRKIDNNTSSVLTKKLSINRIIEIEKVHGIPVPDKEITEPIAPLRILSIKPNDTWGSS